ncbi:MAG: hypothetical protein WC954_04585 [Sphaerochaeta sp.]
MKDEVFRLEQVSLPPLLHDIHVNLCSGEVVGLIAIDALGLEELLEIFQRTIPLLYGHIYVKEQLVHDYLSTRKSEYNVMVIDRSSTLVESMTVEENLFVLRKTRRQHLIRFSHLSQQMGHLLKPYGLDIPPRTLIQDLPHFERLVIQLIKAKLNRTLLVILKEISSFVSEVDLQRLQPILTQLCSEGMTFLYVGNHHEEVFRFASRCYLMREGRIIKHLLADQMNDSIIGHYIFEFNDTIDTVTRQRHYEHTTHDDAVLVCDHVHYGMIQDLTFTVGHGETIVLFDREHLTITDLFALLEGSAQAKEGSITINGKAPSTKDRSIVLVPPKSTDRLLFNQLSVLDNLLFASDHKVHSLWLSRSRRRALGAPLQQYFEADLDQTVPLELERAQRFRLLYQRILLQNPKFLCVVQPFTSADMYQRMELIKIFDELKQKGTSILILAVSLSDTLQIADRLLLIKKGKIDLELKRSEFAQYQGFAGSVPKE